MINLDRKNPNDKPVSFSTIMWKSSILAVIFAVPALGIFLGIYYSTGELLVGAILGFGIHFSTLAFSGRISKWLVKIQS
jgi:uncharacterized membrane protein YkgB